MKIKNFNVLITSALASGLFASSAEAVQYGFGSFGVTAQVLSQCSFVTSGDPLPSITWASIFPTTVGALGPGVLSNTSGSTVICSPNPGTVQLQALYSGNDITTGTPYRLMAHNGTSAPYFAYQLRIKTTSPPFSSISDGVLWTDATTPPDQFIISPGVQFFYAAVALGNTNTPTTGPVTLGTAPSSGGTYSEIVNVNILSP